MSAYRNFVEDFSVRCGEVLERTKNWKNRDVTILFMAASAGFVVPFERIGSTRGSNNSSHPSRDGEKFEKKTKELDDLMEKSFLGSCLHRATETEWTYSELDRFDGNIDNFPEIFRKNITNNKKVTRILKILRNALAHGNLYTFPSTIGHPIARMIFISYKVHNDPTKGFYSLSVPPEKFRDFLKQWFEFLKNVESLKIMEPWEKLKKHLGQEAA